YAEVGSLTHIHAGSVYNVIPETAHLGGTVRSFKDATHDLVRKRIRALAASIAASFGATAEVTMRDTFTVLENSEAHTRAFADVAREIVGDAEVDANAAARMASEDFADMLRQVPGAYIWLGQTPGLPVHNPGYVFDDEIIPIGASLLARIAERRTAAGG